MRQLVFNKITNEKDRCNKLLGNINDVYSNRIVQLV